MKRVKERIPDGKICHLWYIGVLLLCSLVMTATGGQVEDETGGEDDIYNCTMEQGYSFTITAYKSSMEISTKTQGKEGEIQLSFCPSGDQTKRECIMRYVKNSKLEMKRSLLEHYKNYTVYMLKSNICVFKAFYENPASHPGIPELLKFKCIRDVLVITWKKPRHKNGPIDGYILQFDNDLIGLDIKKEHYEIPITKIMNVAVLQVSAYNYFSDKKLLSYPTSLPVNVPCQNNTSEENTSANPKPTFHTERTDIDDHISYNGAHRGSVILSNYLYLFGITSFYLLWQRTA